MRPLDSSWKMTAPMPTIFAVSSMLSVLTPFSTIISRVFSTAAFSTSSRKTTRPERVDMVPSSRLTRPKGTCTQFFAQS